MTRGEFSPPKTRRPCGCGLTLAILLWASLAVLRTAEAIPVAPEAASHAVIALGWAGFSFGPFLLLIALFSSAFEVIQGRVENDSALTAGGVLGLCLLSILFLAALTA